MISIFNFRPTINLSPEISAKLNTKFIFPSKLPKLKTWLLIGIGVITLTALNKSKF